MEDRPESKVRKDRRIASGAGQEAYDVFSAPKLLIVLGLVFLLVVLPAMAGIAVLLRRKESKNG